MPTTHLESPNSAPVTQPLPELVDPFSSASQVAPGDTLADVLRVDALSILSAEDRHRLEEQIFALRGAWTHRDPELPFYTLGVAAYLDATNDRAAEYRRRADAVRGQLDEHFGWLYERVTDSLSRLLDAPCRVSESLALPGFHIFLEPPGATSSSGTVHYDSQATLFDWADHPGVDLDRQLSFTLSVRLPACGGGLLVWDLNERLLRDLSPEQRRERMAAHREPRFVAYSEGVMAVHTGQFLHQIAGLKDSDANDTRITFQGHAVHAADGWILYW